MKTTKTFKTLAVACALTLSLGTGVTAALTATPVAAAETDTATLQATSTVTMHRLYNQWSGEHLYTADNNEKSHLTSIGWQYEGEGWIAPTKSNTPVYRLYNPYSGEHHYTVDKNENNYLDSIGWNAEGVGFYSDDNKGVKLYRLYNPYCTGAGAHHYTKDKSESDYLDSIGWNAEGIGWYGANASKSDGTSDDTVAKHTVSFNSNGGSYVSFKYVQEGQAINKPSNPTKSGYYFVAWFEDKDLTKPHNFSDKVTKDLTLYAKWQTVKSPSSVPPESCVTVYRLINQNTGFYLYTANEDEVSSKVKNDWTNEGKAWFAPQSSSTIVYRCYNSATGAYQFITNKSEYDKLGAMGWKQEGVAFYADDSKSEAIYCLSNSSGSTTQYYYTSNTEEYNKFTSNGWTQKGVAWYASVNPYFDAEICNGDHTNSKSTPMTYVKVKKPFTQTVTRSMYNTECGCMKWYMDLIPDENSEPDLYMRYKQAIAFHWPSGEVITDEEAKAWKIQNLKDSWGEKYEYITTWDQVVDLDKDDEWTAEAYQKQPLKDSYTERQLLDAQKVYQAKSQMALYEHQLKAIIEYNDAVYNARVSGQLAFEQSYSMIYSYDPNDPKDVETKKAQEAVGIKIPVRNVDYCPSGNSGFWQYKRYTYDIYRDTYVVTCGGCGGVRISNQ